MKSQFEKLARLFGIPALVALGLTLPARAQNPKLDLNQLEKLASKADEVVDVTLDGATLRFAEKFMEADKDEDDAEALNIIRKLTGIYVKSFEFDKPDQYSEADVEAIRAQLRNSSWTRMVNVISRRHDDKELDEVYVMADPHSNSNLGLAVLVAEPKELTVVNIVGPIDADHLAALSGEMGVPDFEHKREKHGGKHD